MKNWSIKPLGFSVIRTPYLPENTIDVLANCQQAENAESIRQSLRELIKLSQDKNIIKAIEFASENLASKIDNLSDELSTDNLKLASSIYKYITRMSTRSTPFGAFSSVMTVANKKQTEINISTALQLYLRIDNTCVLALARRLEKKAIKAKNQNLLIRKNTSLYTIAGEIRYIVKNSHKQFDDFKLDTVEESTAINKALSLAPQWLSVATLSAELAKVYPQIKTRQLSNFIFELIKNQLLESNLTIVVSSRNSFEALLQRARQSQVAKEDTSQMERILSLLKQVTNLQESTENNKLKQAQEILIDLLPDMEIKRWLHVDSFRDGQRSSLGEDEINKLLTTVTPLLEYLWKPNKAIDDFTQKFIATYGEAEVPLLAALDVDNGIAFGQRRGGGSPLLKGVLAAKRAANIETLWQPLDQFFMNKIIETIGNGKKVVKISSQEIEKYKIFLPQPKYKFCSSASIHATMLEAEKGETLYQIKSISGPSSLMLLGRFCCGDKSLSTECAKVAQLEQENDATSVYAEIIHIQQALTANVSCRPHLRAYEIVYGPGDSSLETDKQIHCDDLYLVVKSGRLCLFSKKLAKEIKPRLASAHNTGGLNLPIYQFLHAMQGIDGWISDLPLNNVLSTLAYLPEIRIDNIIISPTRWLLSGAEIKEIHKNNSIDAKLNALQILKNTKQLCRYVEISEGDNTLEFDLEAPFSSLLLINEIKNKETVTLLASNKKRTNSVFKQKKGPYRHEFILPCLLQTNNRPAATFNFQKKQLGINALKDLTSLPGENWKYLKIYTGEATADKLLTATITPVATELMAQGSIEKWFFIRYQDPDFHLRVRFKLSQPFNTDALNKRIYQPLKTLYKQGLIKRIVEDSYRPEYHRYGGKKILALCEQLFYLNSVIVSDVIRFSANAANKNEQRWKMCLYLSWKLTLGGSDSLEQMEQFYKKTAAAYDQEFASSTTSKKNLSDNYRQSMKDVIECLQPGYYQSTNTQIKTSIIPQYHTTIKRLKAQCKKENVNILQILQSVIHMDCNRFFVLNQRANEWIIYHYLSRYCRTVIARKFKPGKQVTQGFGIGAG